MSTHVTRSIDSPIRTGLTTASEIWDGPDKGLIFCWEKGREERQKKPELAALAKSGELVAVGRGDSRSGEEEDDHGIWKRGSLQYLAWWQGLRGEDLSVSFIEDIEIVCTKVFTVEDGKQKGRQFRRKYVFPRRNRSFRSVWLTD